MPYATKEGQNVSNTTIGNVPIHAKVGHGLFNVHVRFVFVIGRSCKFGLGGKEVRNIYGQNLGTVPLPRIGLRRVPLLGHHRGEAGPACGVRRRPGAHKVREPKIFFDQTYSYSS